MGSLWSHPDEKNKWRAALRDLIVIRTLSQNETDPSYKKYLSERLHYISRQLLDFECDDNEDSQRKPQCDSDTAEDADSDDNSDTK